VTYTTANVPRCIYSFRWSTIAATWVRLHGWPIGRIGLGRFGSDFYQFLVGLVGLGLISIWKLTQEARYLATEQ